jgi:carboxypeptidase Taq
VPNDTLGVLQDVHWSSGQIGTFCNYTIGNVMAGQLFETASRDPVIAEGLSSGNYDPLRAFMVEHVHQHGRRYSRDALLVKATGRPLDPEPYIAHLTRKYSELYEL